MKTFKEGNSLISLRLMTSWSSCLTTLLLSAVALRNGKDLTTLTKALFHLRVLIESYLLDSSRKDWVKKDQSLLNSYASDSIGAAAPEDKLKEGSLYMMRMTLILWANPFPLISSNVCSAANTKALSLSSGTFTKVRTSVRRIDL